MKTLFIQVLQVQDGLGRLSSQILITQPKVKKKTDQWFHHPFINILKLLPAPRWLLHYITTAKIQDVITSGYGAPVCFYESIGDQRRCHFNLKCMYCRRRPSSLLCLCTWLSKGSEIVHSDAGSSSGGTLWHLPGRWMSIQPFDRFAFNCRHTSNLVHYVQLWPPSSIWQWSHPRKIRCGSLPPVWPDGRSQWSTPSSWTSKCSYWIISFQRASQVKMRKVAQMVVTASTAPQAGSTHPLLRNDVIPDELFPAQIPANFLCRWHHGSKDCNWNVQNIKSRKKKLISSVRVFLSNSEHESNVCLQPTHILLSGGICSFLAVSFWVLFSTGVTVVAGLVPVTPEQQRGGFTFVHGFISQHWEGWGGSVGRRLFSICLCIDFMKCAMTSAPAGGGLLAE